MPKYRINQAKAKIIKLISGRCTAAKKEIKAATSDTLSVIFFGGVIFIFFLL
jgi:hypothetical protein